MLQQAAKFNFKARIIKDENDQVIGKTKKHPPITLTLPVPEIDDIISLLQKRDGEGNPDAEARYILSIVADAIKAQAKQQLDDQLEEIGDDDTKQIDISRLDYGQLTLSNIARIPPSQRGRTAIPEEDWTAFYDDYMAVMPEAANKAAKNIKNHIDKFKKPAQIRLHKPMCKLFVDSLDIYIASSPNIEETMECAQRLRDKFDRWHKAEAPKPNYDEL